MCPEETVLVRLLNGDLPESQARETTIHVEACATCGARYARLRDAWDILGRWQVAPPTSGAELRERIRLTVAIDGRDRAAAARTRARPFWLRVAASVVLAAGAGVAAALVVTTSEPGPGQTADVGQEHVVQVLGLDALGGRSALTAVFEHDVEGEDPQAIEEEQS